MFIYWVLFYEDPQALQNLADYQRRYYGQKLDVPPDIFHEWIHYDPYTGFNTEQADKMMRQKPFKSRRIV